MIIANSLEELTNTVYLASDTAVHGLCPMVALGKLSFMILVITTG